MKPLEKQKYSSLILALITRDAADELLQALEDFKDDFYRAGDSLGSLKSKIPENVFSNVLNLIKKENEKPDMLINYVKKVPTLQITTAMLPDLTFLGQLSAKVYEKTNSAFLIDCKIDKSIIGGCQISLDGFYRDYSVSSLLEKVFQEKNV